MELKMSYHCGVERANRVHNIVEKIGLGQIVKEKYTRNFGQIAAGNEGRYLCVTDTGIIIVKTEDKQTAITMYVATMKLLAFIYGGNRAIPPYLRRKVDRNQSLYTKYGKTAF